MEKDKSQALPNVPIARIIRFWREKSFSHDKGGNFNLNLYLDFCSILNTRNNGNGNK